MQFINAILSPCNRWDNVQNKRSGNRSNKETKLLEYSGNTSEEEGGEGGTTQKRWSGFEEDITHDPYTREMRTNERKEKNGGYRDSKTEMYIYTPVIYKNKVSLGGASLLDCRAAGAVTSPACRVCKSGGWLAVMRAEHQPKYNYSGFQLPCERVCIVRHFSINSFVQTNIDV